MRSAVAIVLGTLAVLTPGPAQAMAQGNSTASGLTGNLSPQLRYEVGRAHARLREYVPEGAQLILLDEAIRTLRARRGSTLTVYCGSTRNRASGNVVAGKFFYVLEVLPAATLRSGYERGSWNNMTADSQDEEHRRLCDGPSENLDDERMLASGERTSSGSTFRPFVNDDGTASTAWLVGNWVAASGCATERDFGFDADGDYHGYERGGRWSLADSVLTLRITRVENESGEPVPTRPRLETWRVTRTGIDAARFRSADGEVFDMIRC